MRTEKTPNSSEVKKEEKKLAVYTMQGKRAQDLPNLFNGRVNQAVLSQAVTMYLANMRTGLASTKTRGEVSGGGKKPWKQKGTGRARAGSTRSPLWRHGGVVFGPHPRSYSYQLPVKLRGSALLAALNEKGAAEDIIVLDSFSIPEPKCREIKNVLHALNIHDPVIFVVSVSEKNIQRAARNMPDVSVVLAKDVNALDILKAKKIIFAKDALRIVEQRVSAYAKEK